jgi:uncharacterized repeat protein (TIGR01451 family)
MKRILLSFLFACMFIGAAKAQNCQAGFVYSTIPGSTLISFYDSSYAASGTITSYNWSFGDSSTSTSANPVHNYNSIGYYLVSLTITTSAGCTSTYFDTINVGTVPCNIVGTITYAQLVQTLTVQVTGGTPPYTYNWSTGSNGQSIQAFAPGNYCVFVTDAQGCTFQACYTVTSVATCQASYTYQNMLGSPLVYFISTSTSNDSIVSYAWDFGDNSTASVDNPIHTYANLGTYGVSLTITTSTGCTSSYWDTVYVGVQPCNLYAIATYSVANNMLDVQTFGGSGPYTYMWTPSSGLSNPTIPNPLVNVSSTTTYCVTVADANACIFTACATVSAAVTDTICGTIFNDVNGNGVRDSSEQNAYGFLNIYGSGGQYTASIDSITGQYFVLVPAGTYTIVLCSFGQFTSYTIPSTDSAGCAFYNNVVIGGGGMHCGYNFGLQYNHAFIEGDIFIDLNNNGIFDSNEAGVPYQPVNIGSNNGYTNSFGHFKLTVSPGTYTVAYTPSGSYQGYALTTASSYSVTVANGATSSSSQFGIYIIPGSTNLAVSIVPHTTVTGGFPAWYNIYVNNIGANATSATLTMQYDSALNFTNASPVQTTHNAGTQTLTWNLPTIMPGSSRNLYVRFTAKIGLVLGTSTFELVDVVANNGIDVNLNNNFDSVHQIVTGSWDPNNKLVVSSNYSNPNYQVISSVNPNQTIDYTINFQNTGTGPAVNVSVLDALSSDLDANSFTLLGTSHNGTVNRNGNQLTFLFPNIMLPDSNSNEPASHGYINFRINANPGLGTGHIILDKADIYFDFNAPVATNDADLLLINPLGILESSATRNEFVSPNPVLDSYTLNFTLKEAADVIFSVKSIQGQTIETIVLRNQSAGKRQVRLDASSLAEGMYVVEINDSKTIRSIKMVKTK